MYVNWLFRDNKWYYYQGNIGNRMQRCQKKVKIISLVGTNEDVKSNEKKTMSSFVFQEGFGPLQHFAKTSMLAGKYRFLHKWRKIHVSGFVWVLHFCNKKMTSMLGVLYGFWLCKIYVYVSGFLHVLWTSLPTSMLRVFWVILACWLTWCYQTKH